MEKHTNKVRSMFKVKVDKQTLSHRCQTAGKVSGGAAEAECAEPSAAASSSSLVMCFPCCSPRCCHPQVRGFGRVQRAARSRSFVRCSHHRRRHHDSKARRKYVRDQ